MANPHSGGSGPIWATSQPRNVSVPSSPHILPVMYSTFWGGNNMLFTTKHSFKAFVCFSSPAKACYLPPSKFTRVRDSSSYCLHFYILIFRQQMPCIRARSSLRWKLLTLSRMEPISASRSSCPSNTVALQHPRVYFFLWRAWFFKHVCFTGNSSWFLTFFPPQTCKDNINREY